MYSFTCGTKECQKVGTPRDKNRIRIEKLRKRRTMPLGKYCCSFFRSLFNNFTKEMVPTVELAWENKAKYFYKIFLFRLVVKTTRWFINPVGILLHSSFWESEKQNWWMSPKWPNRVLFLMRNTNILWSCNVLIRTSLELEKRTIASNKKILFSWHKWQCFLARKPIKWAGSGGDWDFPGSKLVYCIVLDDVIREP